MNQVKICQNSIADQLELVKNSQNNQQKNIILKNILVDKIFTQPKLSSEIHLSNSLGYGINTRPFIGIH